MALLAVLISSVLTPFLDTGTTLTAEAMAQRRAVPSSSESGSGVETKSKSGKDFPLKAVSVVVPCYEEALNVRPLCERLFAATKKAGLETELLLVDDYSGQGSKDTQDVVQQLRKEGYKIDVKVRMPEEGKGLSSAVLAGLKMAKHETMLVMDADLQHEPESVPDVAGPILRGEADFAVGSRHVEGGKAENFPLVRQLISFVATALAYPLTPSTDPMSGFFAISKTTFNRGCANINPMGFKIGLELMVRCGCKNVKDVPITFRDREAGESKLTMKQNFYYLQHLAYLYWFKYAPLVVIVFWICIAILYFAGRFVYDTFLLEEQK